MCLDKIKGGLIGCALGDALGAPLETLSAAHIHQNYGIVTEFLDPFDIWAHKPKYARLKGLYTDDTQQTLLIAESLLEAQRLDPNLLAQKYVDMANIRIGTMFVIIVLPVAEPPATTYDIQDPYTVPSYFPAAL